MINLCVLWRKIQNGFLLRLVILLLTAVHTLHAEYYALFGGYLKMVAVIIAK